LRLRSLRGYHSPEVIPLIDTCPEEVAVAAFAPDVARCIRLLSMLDVLNGCSSTRWGDVRVQGGDHAAQAERRAEVAIEMEAMPPKLACIARKVRGTPPASQRGRYIEGLLRGLSGADLMRAAGLSDRKMEKNRRWLKGIVRACGVV